MTGRWLVYAFLLWLVARDLARDPTEPNKKTLSKRNKDS